MLYHRCRTQPTPLVLLVMGQPHAPRARAAARTERSLPGASIIRQMQQLLRQGVLTTFLHSEPGQVEQRSNYANHILSLFCSECKRERGPCTINVIFPPSFTATDEKCHLDTVDIHSHRSLPTLSPHMQHFSPNVFIQISTGFLLSNSPNLKKPYMIFS